MRWLLLSIWHDVGDELDMWAARQVLRLLAEAGHADVVLVVGPMIPRSDDDIRHTLAGLIPAIKSNEVRGVVLRHPDKGYVAALAAGLSDLLPDVAVEPALAGA